MSHALALAAGLAATLSINIGPDPVAGLTSGVDYEYDTGTTPLNLQMIARPASGPPCAGSIVADRTENGDDATVSLTPQPLALDTGAGLGRVPFTFVAPGRVRVCAWMYRSPDDTAALASGDVEVRAPAMSVAVTLSEVGASAGGADLEARVTGSAEVPADLYVSVVGGGACPATYDAETDPVALRAVPAGTATRVSGTFDLRFLTGARLAFRTWRACAYLQDGPSAARALGSGTATLAFTLKPQVLRRPKVTRAKGGALRCDGGRFKAVPAAKVTITWRRGATVVGPGAVLRGGGGKGTVRCRAVARNALGAATTESRAVRAG